MPADRQHDPTAAQDRRDPACVERWPECESGAYDPRCCRFPKECACTSYPPASDSPAACTRLEQAIVNLNQARVRSAIFRVPKATMLIDGALDMLDEAREEHARLRALLDAHQSEFLSEYRRQFPDWEAAGQEALATFERDALQYAAEEAVS